jgi:DNA-binding response OmpR family regulator
MVIENNINHIVLADDDENDNNVFRNAIVKADPGISLEVIKQGDRLISHISNRKPDLLFLNINLPGKNGFECLLDIRTLLKLNTPVIMYADTSDTTDIKNAYRLGANYFLTKPPSPDLLVSILQILIQPSTEKYNQEWRNFVLDFTTSS